MIIILNLISLQPLSGGLGNWPWCSREEGGLADRRYRYCLTSISNPERRCIGFARRRIGRGGRCVCLIELWPIKDLVLETLIFLYCSEHASVFCDYMLLNIVLWHVELLLGNNCEISKCATAVTM